MNDFLQALRFQPGARPAVPGHTMPDWVRRGLMRSFGEDDLPAYRPGFRMPTPLNQKSKAKNRR